MSICLHCSVWLIQVWAQDSISGVPNGSHGSVSEYILDFVKAESEIKNNRRPRYDLTES